ncbi:DUF3311 domain-containing protein [Sphingomonas sp.]|uniref:DUF3311 domain-containing protein n=1 Tax=Sphingomonas sp. TaxID=28214 RepID=UPI003B3B6FD4
MTEQRDEPRSSGDLGWHRLALLLPFIWQLGLAGFANDVTWRPFGLPFQMVWQMMGVPVASAAIAWVFLRDEAKRKIDKS